MDKGEPILTLISVPETEMLSMQTIYQNNPKFTGHSILAFAVAETGKATGTVFGAVAVTAAGTMVFIALPAEAAAVVTAGFAAHGVVQLAGRLTRPNPWTTDNMIGMAFNVMEIAPVGMAVAGRVRAGLESAAMMKQLRAAGCDLQMFGKGGGLSWNEFQKATRGVFKSRTDAAAWYRELKASNFKVYSYTTKETAEIIKNTQLGKSDPDSILYLTPKGNLSPIQARIELALPRHNTAEALFELDFNSLRINKIQMMRRVTGNVFNQAGGGFEILYDGIVPRNSIRSIR